MKHVENIAIGAAGVAASVASGSIDPEQISNIAQLVVQIIIGVSTLIALFRKKKAS